MKSPTDSEILSNKQSDYNDDYYKKNNFVDSNRSKDNLIYDYFNLKNQRHLVRDTKIQNYNNLFNPNNSINSIKNCSLKKVILKKSNNKSESISQNIENSNDQEGYKVIDNKITSSKINSNPISIKNKNKEKFIIYDVIEENIK